MVNIEFFGTFLCSCKRISFDDCSPLNSSLLAAVLFFKALISFAKLLEPPLHCTFISSFWVKCVVDVVSCLLCFMTHFELEYHIFSLVIRTFRTYSLSIFQLYHKAALIIVVMLRITSRVLTYNWRFTAFEHLYPVHLPPLAATKLISFSMSLLF